MKKISLITFFVTALMLLSFSANSQLQFSAKQQISKSQNQTSLPKQTYGIGTIVGQVTDCNTGIGISNVAVSADNGVDIFETETDQYGNYSLTVDEATYELSFILLGFQDENQTDLVVTQGNTITANQIICEMPYPVSNVISTPNNANTEVLVSWDQPKGPYTIIQDDGSAEDFSVWTQAGGIVAVKFTPAGYPVTVTGGKLFVGDGSFPVGGNWLGDDVAVGVAAADGVNGMPGTITDSVIVSVDEYGWLEFPDVFESEFESGDFYILMWQLGNSPDAAPIGVDTEQPTEYRSYSKMPGGNWAFAPYQDFMIRAELNGPTNSVALNADRNLNKYNVYRIFGFDPDAGEGPEDGTPTSIGSSTSLSKLDTQMAMQDCGFYANAVEAQYDNGDISTWVYSNIYAWCLENVATTEVIVCDGTEPTDAVVTYTGLNYPYQVLTDTTGPSGEIVFDSVIDGYYDITVEKVGYNTINYYDVAIYDDYQITVVLQEIAYPAHNLFVDSLTSVATWDEALIQPLPLEDFEGEEFPPEGWEVVQIDTVYYPETWERINGSFSNWVIPPQDDNSYTWFAAINETINGISDGSTDYLITPPVDLRQSNDFVLSFDSFFDGAFGNLAFVEYSTDSCQTWELLQAVMPGSDWTYVTVDLSELSGIDNNIENIQFAFFSSSYYTERWAIDNVCISNGPAPVFGYYVYLDETFMGETTPETTTFTFENLVYGTEYTAMVRAFYSCGLSEPIYYTWTSTYLYPPRNLANNYVYNTNEVELIWNPPVNAVGDSVPEGVLSFNIFRNGDSIANVLYDSLVPPDFEFSFSDTALNPGTYVYNVSAIYDLSVFDTTLLTTGESMQTEDETVEVIWGSSLPFFEDWSSASFDTQLWQTDNANWLINILEGSDAPSAEFSWQPQMEDYSVSLTSNFLRADSLSEGSIYLDFDLKLEDRNSTANEKLVVEYSLNDQSWRQLKTFENNGSFDFTANSIELSHRVMEDVFQVRFRAVGDNSYNIVGWYVDNIHIYRQCKSPSKLTGEYVWNSEDDLGIEICWEAPVIELPGDDYCYLHWDDGSNAGGIGLSDGGHFSCAARWDAGMLEDCNGMSITKISFVPNDNGFDNVTMKVWYGENAEQLVSEKYVSVSDLTIGVLNEIELDIPVEIDVTQVVWIGYTINNSISGFHPAGNDPGPAIVGYGDKISLDGQTWDNVSDFGPDYNVNWNIVGWAQYLDSPGAKPFPLIKSVFNNSGSKPVFMKNEKIVNANINTNRELAGFNIYRKQIGYDYQLYAQTPWQEGQDDFCFWDAYPDVNIHETYFYKVTAQYNSEIDDCESAAATAYENPDEDFVEVIVTEIGNNRLREVIQLYPNPASSRLFIDSDAEISHISVYSFLGQLMYSSDIEELTRVSLDLALFDNGVYLIRIKSPNAITTMRFVLAR